jgi:A/G-specific adenine glycosylase
MAMELKPGNRSLPHLRRALLGWYAANKRDLPWRRTQDPYRIWVSEIMLQQTRVAAVLGYYKRFLKTFPTVKALAKADEAEVLAAWSGLGYYRRARMMHAAAKLVVASGGFPRSATELRALPGIGRYTAAAIASICYGEAAAVVDGNVERVLWRVSGLQPNDVWQQAQAAMDERRPAEWNQAMMELGATVCVPKSPKCGVCPIYRWCATRGDHPREAQVERKKGRIDLGLWRRGGKVLLVQRPQSARLMARMWELPGCVPNGHEPVMKLRHAITVTDFEVFVFVQSGSPAGKWMTQAEWEQMALTGLARKVLKAVASGQ